LSGEETFFRPRLRLAARAGCPAFLGPELPLPRGPEVDSAVSPPRATEHEVVSPGRLPDGDTLTAGAGALHRLPKRQPGSSGTPEILNRRQSWRDLELVTSKQCALGVKDLGNSPAAKSF